MARQELMGRPYLLIFEAKDYNQRVYVRTFSYRIVKTLDKGQIMKVKARVVSYETDDNVGVIEVPVGGIDGEVQDIQVYAPVEALYDIMASIDGKVATESTLQGIKSDTGSIAASVARPTQLKSASITIDNSAGTSDLVQPLFPVSTPSRSAVVKAKTISNVQEIYIGDSATQAFSLAQGDSFKTEITDLSNVYIMVPVGGVAVLEVLWEV